MISVEELIEHLNKLPKKYNVVLDGGELTGLTELSLSDIKISRKDKIIKIKC